MCFLFFIFFAHRVLFSLSQRVELASAVRKEFPEKFNELQTAGMNKRSQQIERQIEKMQGGQKNQHHRNENEV